MINSIIQTRSALLAGAAVLGLSACTDPAQIGMSQSTSNRDAGVAIGAAAGAILGNVIADDRAKGTILGAAIGAGVGGLIGYDLDRQAAELRAELDSNIQIVNNGDHLLVVMPQDLTFNTDSSVVSTGVQDDLREVAVSLNRYGASTVQVIGHTDNTGSSTYNLGLSQQRAQAVASLLNAYGVNGNRLTTIPRGEEQPVADNLSEAGRAKNRRVEIKIIPSQTS